MIKRILLLVVLGLFLGGVMIAAGGYKFIHGDGLCTLAVTKKEGSSSSTDTIRIGNTGGYGAMHAKIYVGPEISSYAGVGKADSAIIWLYTTFAGDNYLVDSAICPEFPCSLMISVDRGVGDTLLRDGIFMKYLIIDTCSDTTMNITYPVSWNLYLK